jgi:peptide/nickel transport system substrate-binding protein
LLALVELAAIGGAALAATRPRYGGTLNVQLRARVMDRDPDKWPTAGWEREAKIRILEQVFEPLVRLAEDAAPQPALAVSWEHENDFRRWTFVLRPGTVFHDGAALTPAIAADSLMQPGEGRVAVAVGDTLVIRCERPAPELLAELALPRNWIRRRGSDETFHGTGPFRIVKWEPGRRAALTAHDRHWAGRPFLDSIVFEMGRGGREQLVALELGRADVVELSPADLRRASQRGAEQWVSALREVIALEVNDAKLREVLALAIERAPIQTVLLGRQGEISGALLPQWLSGYAFLFPASRDLARARQLAAGLGKGAVTIGAPAADSVARSIAERIAVDLREAGLVAQTFLEKADARVVRLRIASPDPAVALRELGAAGGSIPHPPYEAERDLIESLNLLPLFHVPDLFALAPRVRSFSWRLAGVWLEPQP